MCEIQGTKLLVYIIFNSRRQMVKANSVKYKCKNNENGGP